MNDQNVSCSTLYVGDLHFKVTEKVLFQKFKEYGNILSVRICRDSTTKMSLGYGYVNFETRLEAKSAMRDLNLSTIFGKPCRIMWFERDPSKRNSMVGNIIVKNLDRYTSARDINDIFSEFGKITSCKLKTDQSGASKGCAFVNFSTEAEAKRAIEAMDQTALGDNIITVEKYHAKGGASNEQVTICYIDNCPENFDDVVLRMVLEKYGVVVAARIMLNEDGSSKCFGFVEFADQNEASSAIKELNGKVIQNHKIRMYRVKHTKTAENFSICVRNIPTEFDDSRLRQEFVLFGDISSARVIVNASNVDCPKYGLVSFTDREDAIEAVHKMNGRIFNDQPLSVTFNNTQIQEDTTRSHVIEAKTNVVQTLPNPGTPLIQPWPIFTQNYPVLQFPNNIIRMPYPMVNIQPFVATNEMTSKRLMGEKIYPMVEKYAGDKAGVVMNRLMDLDVAELQVLVGSEDHIRLKVMRMMEDMDINGRAQENSTTSNEAMAALQATDGGDSEDEDSDGSSDNEESAQSKDVLREKLCQMIEEMDENVPEDTICRLMNQGKAELLYMSENGDYLKMQILKAKEGADVNENTRNSPLKTYNSSPSGSKHSSEDRYHTPESGNERVTSLGAVNDHRPDNESRGVSSNSGSLYDMSQKRVPLAWPTMTIPMLRSNINMFPRPDFFRQGPHMIPSINQHSGIPYPYQIRYTAPFVNQLRMPVQVPNAPRDILSNKQLLGEKIYPFACKYAGDLAGKITGKMLELEVPELLRVTGSEEVMKRWIEDEQRKINHEELEES